MADTLDTKIEQLGKQIKEARETSVTENVEKFKKLAEESATTLEEINKLKAAKKAQDNVIKELEVLASRPTVKVNVQGQERTQYDVAFAKWMRKGVSISPETLNSGAEDFIKFVNPGMTGDETLTFKKDLVEGIDPDGGYWIIPERSSQTVTRIFETSPMRQVSTVANTNVDEQQLIIDDNEAGPAEWVGETQSRSDTATPQIGLLTIPVHELSAQPLATQRILDDVSFDLPTWLSNKVTSKMTRQENTAFISGDGAKKPKGILAYDIWGGAAVAEGDDDNYQRDALEYIKSGNASEITYDGLVNLQNALLEDYQPNAVFMMHRLTWGQILQLKDTQDRPLYQLANLLATGANEVLLGKNVIFASDLPTVAFASTPIVYGDFKMGYTILDRIGFRVLRDPYTQKPYTKFYTTKRVGGAVTNYQSLKVQQISA